MENANLQNKAMKDETAIRIGRQYIQQTLKLAPKFYRILTFVPGRPSIIIEFQTEEGTKVEVRIRPRTGNILSKIVDPSGRATFHHASFTAVSDEE